MCNFYYDAPLFLHPQPIFTLYYIQDDQHFLGLIARQLILCCIINRMINISSASLPISWYYAVLYTGRSTFPRPHCSSTDTMLYYIQDDQHFLGLIARQLILCCIICRMINISLVSSLVPHRKRGWESIAHSQIACYIMNRESISMTPLLTPTFLNKDVISAVQDRMKPKVNKSRNILRIFNVDLFFNTIREVDLYIHISSHAISINRTWFGNDGENNDWAPYVNIHMPFTFRLN
jgi:hypothetical protein